MLKQTLATNPAYYELTASTLEIILSHYLQY